MKNFKINLILISILFLISKNIVSMELSEQAPRANYPKNYTTDVKDKNDLLQVSHSEFENNDRTIKCPLCCKELEISTSPTSYKCAHCKDFVFLIEKTKCTNCESDNAFFIELNPQLSTGNLQCLDCGEDILGYKKTPSVQISYTTHATNALAKPPAIINHENDLSLKQTQANNIAPLALKFFTAATLIAGGLCVFSKDGQKKFRTKSLHLRNQHSTPVRLKNFIKQYYKKILIGTTFLASSYIALMYLSKNNLSSL